MDPKIIGRILAEAGVPGLLETLSQHLSSSDFQSLLLEVYRRRAREVSPSGLLQRYQNHPMVQPSGVPATAQMAFDRRAVELLPDAFDVVELSPVGPLGSCSSVAPVHQNNTVSAVRGVEVVSDATNILALECARRRRPVSARTRQHRLCATHRVLRAQRFDEPAAFPHFRLLNLCTAGRDRGSFDFEIAAMTEQIAFYLNLLTDARRRGFPLTDLRLHLIAINPARRAALEHLPLGDREGLQIVFDPVPEQTYYREVRFQIHARHREGGEVFLVDGGFTNWTEQILSDRKERLLTSGMGTERFLHCFAPSSR